jgi:hypothetical protein
MSRTEEGNDNTKAGATLQELHTPRDIIGPQTRALIEEHA